jgi:hypothetical protein
MTGYVGETKDLNRRHMEHKGSIWPGRRELVSKIGEPVIIKTDFKNMKAVQFAEHAAYEKYKAEGYDMLQKPPHPNIFKKYKNKVDSCKICDELGCDFTKERLQYIFAVHRVSKICDECEKVFYYDPKKYRTEKIFNKRKYCSKSCAGKQSTEPWNKGIEWLEQSKRMSGEGNHMYGVEPWCKGIKRPEHSDFMKGKQYSKGHKQTEEHRKNISKSVKGKNTWSKGQNNPSAKLTEQDVFEIKSYLLVFGHIRGFIPRIARVYGVKPNTIRRIKRNESWTDVKVPGWVD